MAVDPIAPFYPDPSVQPASPRNPPVPEPEPDPLPDEEPASEPGENEEQWC